MNVGTTAALVGVGAGVGLATVGTVSAMSYLRYSGQVNDQVALFADLGVCLAGAAVLATAWSRTGGTVAGYASLGAGLALGGTVATVAALQLIRNHVSG